MNENEQRAKLMEFFKVYRKHMLKEKITKEKKTKEKKIILKAYPDTFVLRNKNTNQDELSVGRISTKHVEETLQKHDKEMYEIGKKLLDLKYSFLFEYKHIDQYETYLTEEIEPNETKFEEIQQDKKKVLHIKEKNKNALRQMIENKKTNQKVLIESLKGFESHELNEAKRITLQEYIENGKEIVDLIQNYEEITEYVEEQNSLNIDLE